MKLSGAVIFEDKSQLQNSRSEALRNREVFKTNIQDATLTKETTDTIIRTGYCCKRRFRGPLVIRSNSLKMADEVTIVLPAWGIGGRRKAYRKERQSGGGLPGRPWMKKKEIFSNDNYPLVSEIYLLSVIMAIPFVNINYFLSEMLLLVSKNFIYVNDS